MKVKMSVDRDAMDAIGHLLNAILMVDPTFNMRRLIDQYNKNVSLNPDFYSDRIRYIVVSDYGSPLGYYRTYYHAFIPACADNHHIVGAVTAE